MVYYEKKKIESYDILMQEQEDIKNKQKPFNINV